MYVLLVSVLVGCLFTWFFVRWSRVKNFWTKKGVPHHPPNIILGSLTFLLRQNPAIWLRQMYTDFNSPYVGMWLFWKPGLIINSPEIARNILVKHQDNFRNRFLSSGKSDPVGSLNLFTVNDPTWSNVRRRLTSVFTSAKLRTLQTMTQEKATNLVIRISNDNEKGEQINLRNLCSDYTSDIIGESAFGVISNATLTGDSVIRKITRELMAFNLHRGLSWSSIFFFPELVDYFRFTFLPKKTTTFIRKMFLNIIEQRGGFDKPTKKIDLLDALIEMKREAGDDEEITEDLLLAQASIFLLGGFDTSGTVLTWLIYELAYQPTVQQRLYEELEEAKIKNGNKEFDAGILADLPYLNACIKETIRKFPPMGWLDRVAAKEYQVDEKLSVPAGTIFYVNATGLMMDPENFPEPNAFIPERFLPENEKDIKPFTYLPFGDGPRNCIGLRFANQTMRYALASIFLEYEARWIPGMSKPSDVKLVKENLFLMPEQILSVQFVKRN